MLACRHICEQFICLPACKQLDPIFAYFHPTIRLSVCRQPFGWLACKKLHADWLVFFWLACNHLDVCMQTDWLATVEWLTALFWMAACKQLDVCMQTTLDGLHATNCMETDWLATILFSFRAGIWMSGCWLAVCLDFMWASGCLHAEWLCVWFACNHLDVCMQTGWLDANM